MFEKVRELIRTYVAFDKNLRGSRFSITVLIYGDWSVFQRFVGVVVGVSRDDPCLHGRGTLLFFFLRPRILGTRPVITNCPSITGSSCAPTTVRLSENPGLPLRCNESGVSSRDYRRSLPDEDKRENRSWTKSTRCFSR